jgi:predicted MFS family arabinose efflux permease
VLIDTFGWRAAFWMWLPVGVVVVFVLRRLPEPERGAQDRAFHLESTTHVELDGEPGLVPELPVPELPPVVDPPMRRDAMGWRDVLSELVHIRSMWFGLMALTISGFLMNALGVWGIDFFKQEFDLTATKAGAFVPVIGAGAALGLLGGGELADRLLRRGVLNARVYVTAVSSVLASVILLPAFLTSSLVLAAVLLFFGSICLTVPVAPAEALVSDVVPVDLRGRAAAIRSIVRALAALSPLIVGVISDATDLSTALAALTPMYAIGGVVMLLAARTYPSDLAAVGAGAILPLQPAPIPAAAPIP